jgi:AcrR family transcriptional regulator
MQPEERRAQLVRTAVRAAAEKGLGRLVHADVATAAGVSTPTAFLYFRDREALVKGVIAEVDRFYRELARQAHESDAPPLQRVRNHFLNFSESIETDREYAIVWMEWTTLFRNEYGLWDAFVEFQEHIISCLEKSIRRCQADGSVSARVSAADSARLITAGAYALTQLKIMKRRPRVVARFAEQMLAQALT